MSVSAPCRWCSHADAVDTLPDGTKVCRTHAAEYWQGLLSWASADRRQGHARSGDGVPTAIERARTWRGLRQERRQLSKAS